MKKQEIELEIGETFWVGGIMVTLLDVDGCDVCLRIEGEDGLECASQSQEELALVLNRN